MIDERFKGMFTTSSASTKKIQLADGQKATLVYKKLKLESADIDYEQMSKFNPNVSATLLNIQPMPFKSVCFGDQSLIGMSLQIEVPEVEENSEIDLDEAPIDKDILLQNVMITDLSVSVKENIPIYTFTLDVPLQNPTKEIEEILKQIVIFSFKMEE